jgi:hypothetical protein
MVLGSKASIPACPRHIRLSSNRDRARIGSFVPIPDSCTATKSIVLITSSPRANYAYGIDQWTTQYVVNPGYNPVRGPVSIYAARFHAEC